MVYIKCLKNSQLRETLGPVPLSAVHPVLSHTVIHRFRGYMNKALWIMRLALLLD